jgi:hypothetical protein
MTFPPALVVEPAADEHVVTAEARLAAGAAL